MAASEGRFRRWRWPAVGLAVVLVLGVGAYVGFQRLRPYLHGTSCEVHTSLGNQTLDVDQAANAATIAGVAFRKQLPERAAVIAYATAYQESRLTNLAGGDRDSVGMFQQRPSQGWGSPEKLRDPVQSTSKFFDALVKVKDYLDLDLHDAAQEVQRSADGTAYAQHEDLGKLLAAGFTGRELAAVRCWYPPNREVPERRADAIRELRRTFGSRLRVLTAAQGSPAPAADAVKVGTRRSGWAVAAWAVTHAKAFGLREVRFDGRRWTSHAGHDGWTQDDGAKADRVVIR
ncbi:hypothetical protein [Actinomadura rayongensis]|uniref:hypothetical protein n=1 Tax=Actinomadura rayongensis TaxID=1429076 RepID=UPI00301DE984